MKFEKWFLIPWNRSISILSKSFSHNTCKFMLIFFFIFIAHLGLLARIEQSYWDCVDDFTCKGIAAIHPWSGTLPATQQGCSPHGVAAVRAIFWAVINLRRSFACWRWCFLVVPPSSRPSICAIPACMQCTKTPKNKRCSSTITNYATLWAPEIQLFPANKVREIIPPLCLHFPGV